MRRWEGRPREVRRRARGTTGGEKGRAATKGSGRSVHEREEECAAQVEPRECRIVLYESREQHGGALDDRGLHGEEELHQVRQPLGVREDLLGCWHWVDERAVGRAHRMHGCEPEEEVEDEDSKLRVREERGEIRCGHVWGDTRRSGEI